MLCPHCRHRPSKASYFCGRFGRTASCAAAGGPGVGSRLGRSAGRFLQIVTRLVGLGWAGLSALFGLAGYPAALWSGVVFLAIALVATDAWSLRRQLPFFRSRHLFDRVLGYLLLALLYVWERGRDACSPPLPLTDQYGVFPRTPLKGQR